MSNNRDKRSNKKSDHSNISTLSIRKGKKTVASQKSNKINHQKRTVKKVHSLLQFNLNTTNLHSQQSQGYKVPQIEHNATKKVRRAPSQLARHTL